MTDTPPAVALLFDDSELGGHLRDALHERGARIVHEGGVAGLNRELLQQVGADVLVINLDDDADDALDQLYDIIDGDRPRVVFNDAQASRALSGWDRARWARHLAVKVLAMGDIDPPRPEDAREVQVAPALVAAVAPVVTETLGRDAVDEPATFATPAEDDLAAPIAQDMATPLMADEPPPDLPADEPLQTAANEDDAPGAAFDAHAGIPFDDEIEPAADPGITAESDDLAAELEALLASGELPDEEDEQTVGAGLRFTGDEELPPLHDGDFGVVELADSDDDGIALDESAPSPAVDELDFSALDAPELTAEAMDAAASVVPAAPETPVRAPDNWALLDEEAPVESNDKPDAAAFGIEKLSAAEFLAPDVEPVAADLQPTMSLELVSMEEAIAPQAFVPDHEMVLDELGSALSRIVLLGAAVDGVDSVCEFMRSLPASTRLTFLLTQHLGNHTEQEMLARLAEKSPLPVRVAEAGRRVGMGEVLMVPAGQQVRLRRDGSVELLADAAPEPSIDASLSMAANGFGRDAVAIVFAGRGNDAIAGSQAIHDRGGQVWVESSSGDHFADMVSGIFAERLVSFSGTPSELAAHLIEVFP
ncbi:MAG: chemotaxis protein CheB [Rhodanobacter sp.]|nr:chemotaxis protein CheB [Rhodanobacter sp.]OJW31034.1 MAG: chemotaxis protein CheB [Rhodanobacter sp. 67-28]